MLTVKNDRLDATDYLFLKYTGVIYSLTSHNVTWLKINKEIKRNNDHFAK